jgi:hypothetical protein
VLEREKEVRSIQNCSLEKLSLDDAIQGLKVQAANMARMLDEERVKRQLAEQEVESLYTDLALCRDLDSGYV